MKKEMEGRLKMFKAVKNTILSIGRTLKEPVFLKEYTGMDKTVSELENLKKRTNYPEVKNSIEMDIVFIKQGAQGEKNVYFELKNSFLPMYILHDVRIQHGDYNAQLDFVIITSKFICILETKKLNGDITINNQGEFIRAFKNSMGKVYKKEGMYSPISQNKRHVRILQDMLLKEKIIRNTPVISLVVMANPKNIIDFKYAPKEIKQQIVKCDQLVPFLKKKMNEPSQVDLAILTMEDIAESLVSKHIETEDLFIKKYEQLCLKGQKDPEDEKKAVEYSKPTVEKEAIKEPEKPRVTNLIQETRPINIEKTREDLIAFRRVRSKEEGIAAYYIFNNKQMEDIIAKLPKTKEELKTCNGFGPAKAEKYGDAIINIITGR